MICILIGLLLSCGVLLIGGWTLVTEARRWDLEQRRLLHKSQLDFMRDLRDGPWCGRDQANDFQTGKPKRRKPYAEVRK